jgi:beta-galactosidase
MRAMTARRWLVLAALLLAVGLRGAAQPAGALAQSPRVTTLFDAGWKFHRGGAQYAEQADFDDAAWRSVDLPHDWSLEDLPGRTTPFDPDAIGQVSTGFTVGGTGWYRKSFTLPQAVTGKRIVVRFDGVYMNPEIWINGESLGSHPYGYTSFWFDISDKIKIPGTNVLAVKVRNEGETSRWYSGSGIYRHVWLEVLDPVHVAQWGTSVTTAEVSAASARVTARARVQNDSGAETVVTVSTSIIGPGDVPGGLGATTRTIAAHAAAEFSYEVVVRNPALWSPDSPSLYRATTQVSTPAGERDRVETTFGIRSVTFDAVNGFRLNGVAMKLQGGCVHQDNGPLGARSYDRAEERRVQLLKASGFNAIRCAHNPPAPAFLEACDRLGMLVIDEAFDMWNEGKNPHDYSLFFDKAWRGDLDAMIARDRNHPSVVAWSIGNEIPGMDNPATVQTAKSLAAFVREADPSRPVLAAVNNLNPKKDPYFAALDVAGYNYGSGGDHGKATIFTTDHERVPSRIMVQTESYPLEAFGSWMDVLDHPWLIGDFVWTAFDYVGEASIGWRGYWQEGNFYPWTLAFTGDLDIAGWKRPQSYYRDVLWKRDQISIFVKPPSPSFPENPKRLSWSKWHWRDAVADWNWPGQEGRPLQVSVYSSFEEAELLLNGRSLGRKRTDRSTEFTGLWDVPYEAGELRAVGYRGGKAAGSALIRSAREVARIVATPDRDRINADGQDLSYVTIELQDAAGVRHPKADNTLAFEIDGPGTIVGVANANPMSVESYQRPERKAWQGRCLVVIKAGTRPGEIRLRVTSAGLPETVTLIRSAS